MSLSKFLPARVAQYASIFEAAAKEFGLPPELIAAICDRETLCGTATVRQGYDMPGPGGRGDAAPRNPAGRWKMALPPDGRGWGHGLMQIDFGSHAEWCQQKQGDAFLWESAEENIRKGAEILAHSYKTFAEAWQTEATICAYNAGEGAGQRVCGVLAGMQASSTAAVAAFDKPTTGGNYVSDVLARMEKFK